MTVVLFVLGRPGCGKSTATRYMVNKMRERLWQADRIKDYEILYEMFEQKDPRFRATNHGGFDVVEFSVLDEALCKVQSKAMASLSAPENTFITIEFARSDYKQALKQFNLDFLKSSYFLCVDASLEICVQRIHERIKNPARFDNHFVSDEIVRGYYGNNGLSYMRDDFSHEFGINPQHVKTIENNGALDEFIGEVDSFLLEITRIPALP
jgi:adenylate kinase family enzyme